MVCGMPAASPPQANHTQLSTAFVSPVAGGGLPLHDPLHPEVRTLRERLEEERQALLAR